MPLEQSHGSHTEVDQLRLRSALNRYLVSRADPDGTERHAARLALVDVLEGAGWEPPPAVRAALAADERAVHGAAEQARGRWGRRSA